MQKYLGSQFCTSAAAEQCALALGGSNGSPLQRGKSTALRLARIGLCSLRVSSLKPAKPRQADEI